MRALRGPADYYSVWSARSVRACVSALTVPWLCSVSHQGRSLPI